MHEAPPPTHHKPRFAALSRKWQAWKRDEFEPHTLFWIAFALILVGAALLRTFRIDMPPIDFPADRQRTNMVYVDLFMHGESLFSFRKAWAELWILPWLTARTNWLRYLFFSEIWTWARIWSVFFGLVTVAMAAYAGFWAATTPDAPESRRRRIALLWMAAIAFNHYHLSLSRMISTESVTLGFQMCAVAFFWSSWRNPRRFGHLVLFLFFFVLSGWAKIPSLIWLPGFFLYFMVHPAMRGPGKGGTALGDTALGGRMRLVLLATFAIGTLAIFVVYKINPFKLFESYGKNYSFFAQHASVWMGSPLWTKTYASRTILMLTLPGAFFALVGLLSAPWLFRISMGVFLVLFYGLVNLNLYNYCHAIIPGMALAAWGVNSFIEATSAEPLALRSGQRRGRWARWLRLARQAGGPVLAGLIILLLYPLGPDDRATPTPRSDVIQALQVIKANVPPKALVIDDDIEGSLGYMERRPGTTWARELDLRTGYYYSIDRFTDRTMRMAAEAWAKWANLPGEPNGILFTRQPTPLPAAELKQFARVPKGKKAPAPPFEIESFLVPAKAYDAARQKLVVNPGSLLKIGISWRNENNTPLAGINWSFAAWRQYIPVPIREGGFSMWSSGVLCVPKGRQATAFYTFEIPKGFPSGSYYINYFPQNAGPLKPPAQPYDTFPFVIVCESASATPAKIEMPYRDLYPATHNGPPLAWSGNWFYRNMTLEGYKTNAGITNFLSCPLSRPGLYELTIRGEGIPVTNPNGPENLWPAVEVYLPGDRTHPAARVSIRGRGEGRFKATFTAYEPFDSLLLKGSAALGNSTEAPLWMLSFAPASYGKQVITLRGARLELKRAMLPGTLDTPEKTMARKNSGQKPAKP